MKVIVIFLLLAICFLPAKTFSECTNGDCVNGHGTMTYPDGSKYEGQWKDNKRNGQGTLSFPDGGRLAGQWKDGHFNGQGTMTYSYGVYEGHWKDGMKNGQGIMTYSDGSKYEGQWKDDRRNGQGAYTYPGGGKYVGQWKEGKKNGQGIYIAPDNYKYTGQFKNGKTHGQGVMIFADGSKYEGQWRENKRNGQGSMSYPDGSKYEGQWKNDVKNGQGTYTYSDSVRYVDHFKDGKAIGQGIMTFPDGRMYEGKWKNGKFIKNLKPLTKQKPGQISTMMSTGSIAAPAPDAYPYTIQFGSYKDRKKANSFAVKLRKKGVPAFVCPARISGKGKYYRVFIGSYRTLEETRKAASKLKGPKGLHPLEAKMPYAIRVGTFDSDPELKKLEADLRSKAYLTYSIPDKPDNNRTRLLIGAFRTEKDATELTKKLQQEGFNAKVVRR
ncbi:MAG: SPOR domain-containing protein [Deltaproteobacteria bacterium]|nr:SPOR domain-containing protein [Deltaproteobacteria bacterium]